MAYKTITSRDRKTCAIPYKDPITFSALHALEPLVESDVRIAVRLRPHQDLPVEVPLFGGNDCPQGSAWGTSIVARPRPGAGLFRPPLGFLPQLGLGSKQATYAWCALVFRLDPGILRVNGRPVLVGDGIKVAKAGRKMRVFDCTR